MMRRWSRFAATGCALFVAGALLILYASESVRRSGVSLIQSVTRCPGEIIAIIPGAAVWAGNVPSHMLEDRVRTAVRLWQEGRVVKLLMSGNREAGYDEPAAMRALAKKLGVPDESILEDPQGWTTRHTMRNAARIFSIRSAIIVTQAYHLPRALYLAQAAGICVTGEAADRRVYRDQAQNEVREFFARVKAWLQEL